MANAAKRPQFCMSSSQRSLLCQKKTRTPHPRNYSRETGSGHISNLSKENFNVKSWVLINIVLFFPWKNHYEKQAFIKSSKRRSILAKWRSWLSYDYWKYKWCCINKGINKSSFSALSAGAWSMRTTAASRENGEHQPQSAELWSTPCQLLSCSKVALDDIAYNWVPYRRILKALKNCSI